MKFSPDIDCDSQIAKNAPIIQSQSFFKNANLVRFQSRFAVKLINRG
jgi:hypothetical protein